MKEDSVVAGEAETMAGGMGDGPGLAALAALMAAWVAVVVVAVAVPMAVVAVSRAAWVAAMVAARAWGGRRRIHRKQSAGSGRGHIARGTNSHTEQVVDVE